MPKISALTLAIILSTLAATMPAEAASKKVKPKVVVAQAKNLSKSVVKLQRLFSRLSAADKLKVIDLIQSKGTLADSDADGVSDVFEDDFGSGVCDSDSDDDGLEDGDEVEDGRDPMDDDDGREDGLRAHAEGLVSSVDGLRFVIDGVTFLLNDASEFGDGLAAEDLVVGACVEVRAHRLVADGEALVDQVKAEDDCDSRDCHLVHRFRSKSKAQVERIGHWCGSLYPHLF